MRSHPTLRWTALAFAAATAAACNRERPVTEKEAPADTTAAVADKATKLTTTRGFNGPESARYDADLDVWFVSNVNGAPTAKDSNGYIARLTGDGRVDSLRFIAGGRQGVTLHAPKGLVIVGDTLWVADIDALRAFHKRTGAPIATVSLEGQAKFLNDGAVGPDGIYFTDTGLDGKMGHIGPDRIFRLAPDRQVKMMLESDSLLGPNGITWDAAGGRFVIVPLKGKPLRSWRPGDSAPTTIGMGPGGYDGVEMLPDGGILFTSWADMTLSVWHDGRVTRMAGQLPSPADIGIDRKTWRVAVPLLLEDRVEFLSLPRTESAGASAGSVATENTHHGEWIYIPRGTDSIRAYIAYSERSVLSPAVIVIHEIFGLTPWEPTVADRLAKSGFIAIAPDLLSSRFGSTPADGDSARKLVAQLEPARITADLDATYAYLNSLPAVARGKIGTIGFCWGGGQSFRYATTNPNLRAAVVCYGPAPDTAALRNIRAPVLGVYGENDARINTALPEVSAAMKARGKRFEHDVYPGTGHGFLKPGRVGNDGPEPARAWERITAFLRTNLGS